MKYQVEVPDEVFWKIAARAETFEMRVPDYTAELVISASVAKLPQDQDPVVIAWRAGLTDREIARKLNKTNAAVATRRRRFQLPANRRTRDEGSN